MFDDLVEDNLSGTRGTLKMKTNSLGIKTSSGYAVMLLALTVTGVSAGGSSIAEALEPTRPTGASTVWNTREIEPADVLVRVTLVRAELELLRFKMGKPKIEQPEINVTGVAPREAFFQAMSLFRKANLFCQEQTGEGAVPPATPPSDQIRPAHVLVVVDAALRQIRQVKAQLGNGEQIQEIPRDPGKGPNDVFRSIVQANRQLSLLLDQQVPPSEVFRQVTLSMNYTSGLLARFPGAERNLLRPAFEPGKRAEDVSRRLVDCYTILRAVAEHSGVKVLELNVDDLDFRELAPSDTYDFAALLVSELAYFHSLLPNADPPAKVYYSGRRFPSHVFQQAGILESQLNELRSRTKRNPTWSQN